MVVRTAQLIPLQDNKNQEYDSENSSINTAKHLISSKSQHLANQYIPLIQLVWRDKERVKWTKTQREEVNQIERQGASTPSIGYSEHANF